MKYVIMIHSNPEPWGHPTSEYLAAHQELPAEVRERLNADFEQVMTELHANGELVVGEALADPRTARLYRWRDGTPLATDGPYSEAKEHLAGFFLIDVEDSARAEAVAATFAGPGETVELRPLMWPGGSDQ
ncbi:YciI family protein [Micromonospora aurantiaca (nom. illeg.)]|uniref:YciI family protein n=1 Tax=Micromonospora aurantiaca (nom. illeg.) TaxID=47850 RepID=UPI003EBE32FF